MKSRIRACGEGSGWPGNPALPNRGCSLSSPGLTGQEAVPPSLSQGVIFGSLSRPVLPRPRELTGSKKAPWQRLTEESWHIQFRKVSLSVTRAQDVRREGGGSGSRPAQVQLRGGGAPGPERPAGRVRPRPPEPRPEPGAGVRREDTLQSQEPGQSSEIICLKLFPEEIHFWTTAGTVSTGSLEQARGDMPTNEPGQRPE